MGIFCLNCPNIRVPFIRYNSYSHDIRNANVAFYLPPAAEACGQEIIKRLPYMRPYIHLSRFHINLNISFICKISSPNLQGMFMAMKNVCVKFWPHLKKKTATIANC